MHPPQTTHSLQSQPCPYFSTILTANFWFTKLSLARRMSNTTSFVAAMGLTVLSSRAEMSAEARSCTLTGVVTSELMLLSKHHFTTDRKSTRLNSSHQIISYAVFCLKK